MFTSIRLTIARKIAHVSPSLAFAIQPKRKGMPESEPTKESPVQTIMLKVHMYSAHARVGLKRSRRQFVNRVKAIVSRVVVLLFVLTVYAYALQTV